MKVHRRGNESLHLVAACSLLLGATTAWIVIFRAFISNSGQWEPANIYLLTTGVLIAILGSTVYPRRFIHLPPAKGGVVCIVPAYSKTTEA